MTEQDAATAVRATLAVMARLAEQTRTPTDNVLVQMLQSNESRLTRAVLALGDQPATPERVAAALASVGITVK